MCFWNESFDYNHKYRQMYTFEAVLFENLNDFDEIFTSAWNQQWRLD